MITTNKTPHSINDIIKYYIHLIKVYHGKTVLKLRKGDRPTQTKVFIACSIIVLVFAFLLNMAHVVHFASQY